MTGDDRHHIGRELGAVFPGAVAEAGPGLGQEVGCMHGGLSVIAGLGVEDVSRVGWGEPSDADEAGTRQFLDADVNAPPSQ